MERLICLVIGYAFGLIETGFIYGKIKHTDIRKHGSGNAGTTNVLRTFGAKGGAVTFIGDFLKAVLAVLLVWFIFREQPIEVVKMYQMYAALGAVLGHDFPFYMGFKGGKGIASSAGGLIVVDPIGTCVTLVCFVLIVAVSKYVSLGSICAAIIMAIAHILSGTFLGTYGAPGSCMVENYAIMIFMAALAIYRHRANIGRLMAGQENKLSFGKKKAEDKGGEEESK